MAQGRYVAFKGTKTGIILQLDDQPTFTELLSALEDLQEQAKSFFRGAKVIGTEGRKLNVEEKRSLAKAVEASFGMHVVSLEHVVPKPVVESTTKKEAKPKGPFAGLEEGMTKFVRGTLRSGRSVEFEGNVVVLGDVNPGAEIIACGNIVVMGSLRGVAHAGADGNELAYVMASKLQPTQLRIASLITRPPEDSTVPDGPEIALIKDQMIMIEPYL